MLDRRAWLVAGAVGLVASAARAGVEGSGEINGYGGTSPGAWACGPAARVQYGGVGARGRIYVDSTHPAAAASGEAGRAAPTGLSLGVAGAWESRKYSLLDCRSSSDNLLAPPPASCPLPPSGPVTALGASLGYDGEKFGLRLGVLRYGRYFGADDPTPTYRTLPEASLRIGLQPGPQVVFGLGSYDASTMLRPGLWAGGFVPISTGDLIVGGHIGAHQNFDGNLGLRLHVQLAAALGSGVDAVIGGSVSQGYTKRPEPEGSLALRFNGGI